MKIADIKKIINIGDVRQRLGCDNIEDTSMDSEIEKMSPKRLVELESAWTLGCESWADEIITNLRKLEQLELRGSELEDLKEVIDYYYFWDEIMCEHCGARLHTTEQERIDSQKGVIVSCTYCKGGSFLGTYNNILTVETVNAIPEEKWGVHINHCCVHHGCKYGDLGCPVATKKVDQKHPCEDCSNPGPDR